MSHRLSPFLDGNGTFYFTQRGLKFVGEFSEGRPDGHGTVFNADGDVVQPFGPWGGSGSDGGTFTSLPGAGSGTGSGNGFFQSLDFRSNKYANLVRMIGGWVSDFLKKEE